MTTALFYLFGGIAILSAISVVAQKRVFYSAMSLVVCLCAISAEYLLLEAPFIAAVQVIVYAGAIMVLFLFVIMLLDPFSATALRSKRKILGYAAILLGALVLILMRPILKAYNLLPIAAVSGDAGSNYVGADPDRHYWRCSAGAAESIDMDLTNCLLLSLFLFVIGAVGFIIKKNLIAMFLCLELMLNAVNLSFIAFSKHFNQVNGQIFVFLVMVVAAVEAAVGLAITIVLYRNRNTLNADDADTMKW
jgi:NADH-quinone oxidoreductase subunit K